MEVNPILKGMLAGFVAVLLAAFGFVWFSGAQTKLKLPKPVAAIGSSTQVLVEVDAPHGVKAFSAAIEQGGQSAVVYQDKTKTAQRVGAYEFSVGQKQAAFLKEGPAHLTMRATSNDFRGATSELGQDVQVVLRPPTVSADGLQHYINQGGAELVMLDVGGNWTEAGVRVANYSAGSFAMPGQPDSSTHRFSLFPFPWDVSLDTTPLAFVRNGAGMEATASFWTKIFPKKFRESTINVTDKDLRKVVGELDPEGTGSLLERFVKLNRDMRRSNSQTIYELRNKTEHKILWSGAFVPVKGARESFFADRRSYVYQGKKFDQQVHLGYDLAQTMNSPVKAANSGKVIYADRLGLYGNCVIIDHGYSLQSLYGHMSKLLVKVGDTVAKEQQIGVSGATGMAFGDHVHFSMMIAGIQVDPKEWWDEHWIHDRILSKIGSEPQTAQTTAPPPAATPEKQPAKRHHTAHRR
jgi:murein DD-endopeptidase MepM/ murein hydrolase activator NlpD